MNNKQRVYNMVLSGLLCAMGIAIPMFFPRIQLEPMSFTLASHVPIFISMFISLPTAVAVGVITAFGFFFTATPVIAMRALSHLGFVILGSLFLKKQPGIFHSMKKYTLFGLMIAVVHAVCEVIAVSAFYFAGSMTNWYASGYLYSVLLLVGVGTMVHSMVDFYIAYVVWRAIQKSLPVPAAAKQ